MKTATKVTESYKNPQTFATNSIRYFQVNGKHVVVHEMHAGEDYLPNVYRCETVEEARIMWTKLRGLLSKNGYTVRK